jgi:hypothetical protein
MSTDSDLETTPGREPVELDHSAARTSSAVAGLAGLLVVVTTVPFSVLALLPGLGGLLCLAVGLFAADSRRWVTLGALSLGLAVVAAGALGGATTPMILTGTVAVLVSWDVGQHAVTIGDQFGVSVPTRRGELVHAAASVIVGTVSAGIIYGVYTFGTGNQPVLAVVLLLAGSVLLVWALR